MNEQRDAEGRPLTRTGTPIDAEAYEQEVYWRFRIWAELEETGRLSRGGEVGPSVRAARLEGAHPDTRLVAEVLSPVTGGERPTAFEIWHAEFLSRQGRRDPPSRVAAMFLRWIREGHDRPPERAVGSGATAERLDPQGRPLQPDGTPIDVEAYEQEVYWRIRLGAEWEEILHLQRHGEKMNEQVRRVERVRSYPDTRIDLIVWSRVSEAERTPGYRVWDEAFLTSDGHRHPPGRVAGDMLVWARGG